ncbi:Rpn family recombination-promoting nuclease/putative transposase [Magnetococcales bacterium HHB-1]
MKHRIDPTVDCVFKALFASQQNQNLLIDFLNAVIDPVLEHRIMSVEVLNPYNEKEFVSDKLSIVDIKAVDGLGKLYQVEIQISTYGALRPRMTYTLCDLYTSQLEEGESYQKLKPAIAIWVIPGVLLQDAPEFHHHFQLFDATQQVLLHDHLSLHVLELEKWQQKSQNVTPIDRWTRFLREGKNLDADNLPSYMQTKEMRQAMDTLRKFSEKEKNYHQYQSRMNFIREQQAIKEEHEAMVRKWEEMTKKWEETVQKKNIVVQERNDAVQERNDAVQERNDAVQERNDAVQERNDAVQERNDAVQERNDAVQERNDAIQKQNKASQEREKAAQERDVLVEENKKLRQALKEAGINQ